MDAGKLVTVFSAPDYPQFQCTEERFNNKASVLKLLHPGYSDFKPITYSAAERPLSAPFYDLGLPGSDDEFIVGPHSSLGTISDATNQDSMACMSDEELVAALQAESAIDGNVQTDLRPSNDGLFDSDQAQGSPQRPVVVK
jgi:hypothetical protein